MDFVSCEFCYYFYFAVLFINFDENILALNSFDENISALHAFDENIVALCFLYFFSVVE